MSDRNNLLLAELSEFRQTLVAEPPKTARWTGGTLAIMVVAALVWTALTRVDLVVRANGRIRPVATPQQVKSKHSGRVVEVAFSEGKAVQRGDVLCRLETGRIDAEIRKRELIVKAGQEDLARYADLAQQIDRQHKVELETIAVKQKEARESFDRETRRRDVELARAKHDVSTCEREHGRELELVRRKASTESALERAAGELANAKRRVELAEIPVDTTRMEILKHELRQIVEGYSAKLKEHELKVAARRTEVESARRELESLLTEKAEATVVAPIDGIVVAGELKVGELIESSKALVEIAPDNGFVFEGFLQTSEVADLRMDMPARVSLEAFDRNIFGSVQGKVSFISADAAMDGKGNSSYRVLVAIDTESIGTGDKRGDLKLGMTGNAEIISERESLLSILFRRARKSISFQ